METQIQLLIQEIERLILSLSLALKEGSSDGVEVRVALAKLSEESNYLRSLDGRLSRNLDDIYADVKNLIAGIEINPLLQTNPDGTLNASFHQKLSTYIEGKFRDDVINETYARVVGDSDKYPDGDKILNTFKELQRIIGASDTETVGIDSILSRLSQLQEELRTARLSLETKIVQEVSIVQNALNAYIGSQDAMVTSLWQELETLQGQLASVTTQNDADHSTLEARISSVRDALQNEIDTVKSGSVAGLQSQLDGVNSVLYGYTNAVGSANEWASAITKLGRLSVKSIWSVTGR